MFEYINPGFILIAGLITFGALFTLVYKSGEAQDKGTKMEVPYMIIVFAMISIAIAIIDGYTTHKKVMLNKKAFEKHQELVCSTLTTSYLVSKSKGWSRRRDKVTDGKILIDLQFCKKY